MTSFEQQIVYAFEVLCLSPAQIATQFEDSGENPESILKLLSEHSTKYIRTLREREKVLKTTTGDSSSPLDEELLELESEYRILAKSSENDLVRERALKFLINEKKGRNDLGDRNLKLKERALKLVEVDTSRRAIEFIEHMKKINAQIHNALNGEEKATLELK